MEMMIQIKDVLDWHLMLLPALGFWGQLLGIGLGAAGGLFGKKKKGEGDGDGGQLSKEQRDAQNYWLQRQRDQEAQATQWSEGNRTNLENQFGDLWDNPGYSPEEAAGLRWSDAEAEGMYYSPEEQARMRISPEEEAGVLHMAGAPVSGAANRAQDMLMRGAAARGGYAPGLNASALRIQQEQGRQAAESVLGARLGITSQRREADTNIANQRSGVLNAIANNRTGAVREIGTARIGGRQFAAQGRLGIQGMDDARVLGQGQLGRQSAFPAGSPGTATPWWMRAAGGATDALSNLYNEEQKKKQG